MAEEQRASWMTAALEAELRAIASGGMLTCEQIQEFAAKHAIEITKMKPFVDAIGLNVSGCRGLCA